MAPIARVRWLAAVALLGCQPAPPAPPPPAPRPITIAREEPCLGGLLCESPKTVSGFRLPRHCEPRRSSPRLQVCRVEAPDLAPRIDEFLTSRYPQLEREAPGIYQVRADRAVLRVRVAGDRADFSVLTAN
ncbi:MAG: hypothetical protein HY902_09610 [Deltaproteobacteria bacterium]|nr:hypothetical protein [Deltaproteobacteria bacterium]